MVLPAYPPERGLSPDLHNRMKIKLSNERRKRYRLILTHWLLMEAIPPLAVDQVLVSRKDNRPFIWNPHRPEDRPARNGAAKELMADFGRFGPKILIGVFDLNDYLDILRRDPRLDIEPGDAEHVDNEVDKTAFAESTQSKPVFLLEMQLDKKGEIDPGSIVPRDIITLLTDTESKPVGTLYAENEGRRNRIVLMILELQEKFKKDVRKERAANHASPEEIKAPVRVDLRLLEQIHAEIIQLFPEALRPMLKDKMSIALGRPTPNGSIPSFYIRPIVQLLSQVEDPRRSELEIGDPLYLALERANPERWQASSESGCDILAEPKRLYDITSPKRFNRGRWPNNPKHHLVIAQQIALSRACQAGVGGVPSIVAVNGPPGTGKTTLLKDLFAEVVVRRAQRLIRLNQFSDGLVRIEQAGDSLPPELSPELVDDFAIVVTSNNNLAVENITKSLPFDFSLPAEAESLSGAERKTGPDGKPRPLSPALDRRTYFPELGARLVDPENPPSNVWCAGSAALGSKANFKRASQALFEEVRVGDDKQRPRTMPYMAAVLERYASDIPDIRIAWQNEVNHFVSLSRKVERELDALEKRFVTDVIVTRRTLERIPELVQPPPPKNIEPAQPTPTKGTGFLGTLRRIFRRIVGLSEPGSAPQGNKQEATALSRSKEACERTPAPRFRARMIRVPDPARMIDLSGKNNPRHLDSFMDGNAGVELDRLRSELFLSALQLHKLFLIANREDMVGILRRSIEEDLQDTPRGLATFGFFCPVVSYTLATFALKLSTAIEGSIGWVVVDEAGQATLPSSIVPLNVAKRIVIVGDPAQVPPVITVPKSLAVRTQPKERGWNPYSKGLGFWNPMRTSLQEMADRTQDYGSRIRRSDGSLMWTGLPLRAHRRCCDPMFSISNDLSYAGQMVLARDLASKSGRILVRSRWVDAKRTGKMPEGNYVPEEWEAFKAVATEISNELKAADAPEKTCFICTPFRDVVNNVSQLIKTVSFPKLRFELVGTIHKLQGREADIVFFILGGKTTGARAWAAGTPNLLNVAVTRAKESVIFIGERKLWKTGSFAIADREFDEEGKVLEQWSEP